VKGDIIPYSDRELRWIKRNCARPRKEAHAEFQERFWRTDVSLTNFNSLCKRMGWMTGRTGGFEKGLVPHNKGKEMPPEVRAKCMATAFKKGNPPHNTRYLGHERLSQDGYVEVSVAETNPHTGYERRYVLKHVHEWQKVNGPVPEGHALKCLDGNRQNTDPSNWEAIPRAMLPRLAGRSGRDYDNAPDELKPAIMAVAKLEHAIREARG